MKRKWITGQDIIWILAVLLAALLLFLPQWLSKDKTVVAEVSVDGAVVQEILLSASDEKQEYVLENGLILETENGAIRVLSADCPDALCIHTGAISRAGEVIACVPNKTVVALHSEKGAAVDGITY